MIDPSPSPKRIAALGRLLDAAGFTEAGVCERLGIPEIYSFEPAGTSRTEPADLLDLLVILFLDGMPVEERRLREWVSPDGREALEELGLLARLDEERVQPTAVLYPTGPLRLASDSPIDPRTGGLRSLAPDAVYPAITDAARDFVSVLPPAPRGRFLELCSGTGIGALLAATTAERAWAVDITERSTRFARFNVALNGFENVTAIQGDLYEPLEDLQFDTIVAHPPYVPSTETRDIFRDGGSDGEQVTRGILAGLGNHLAPGGTFHCTCLLTERRGRALEDRIRDLLGPFGTEFDVLLMPLRSLDPVPTVAGEVVRERISPEEARRRLKLYEELEVEGLVYGSLALRRGRPGRRGRSLRRARDRRTTGEAVDWLLRYEFHEDSPTPDALAGAVARAPDSLQATADLTLRDGAWHPVSLHLRTRWPFPTSVRCAPWVSELLARLDGRRALGDVLDGLRRDGVLPSDAPMDRLLELAGSLVSAGLVELLRHPLPDPPDEDTPDEPSGANG